MPAVVFNIDPLDDPLMLDGTPSFDGGMVSNNRANLLKPNESALLINCDIDRFGRIRTRRGISHVYPGTVGSGTMIQGLTCFNTNIYNRVVAANDGKVYWLTGGGWTQIALGGVLDNDAGYIFRLGTINNAGGYPVGTTSAMTVDGFVGVVANGEYCWFTTPGGNQKVSGGLLYKIVAHVETAGNTTSITLDAPGLLDPVGDNYLIHVQRPFRVNNGAGYAGGTLTMTIDGYTGIVNNGEIFTLNTEGGIHTISAHSETAGNTTSITFAPGILPAYVSGDTQVPINFAQGINTLYWTDGLGSIWGWDGTHTIQLTGGYKSSVDPTHTAPTKVGSIVWFQNRLIASAISDQLDAIYFSDFLDPTSWDSNFQQVRVGAGDNDAITGLLAWTDLNLIVLKRESIYVINLDPAQNPDPTDPTQLVANYSIKALTKNLGCPAPLTAAQIGGRSDQPGSDVFFLASDMTVRSVRRTLAAEQQQQIGEPLSLDPDGGIQDILNRINRNYISRSRAIYHDNHYILAIPIDGATRPNAVIAFHTLTQSWTGAWIGWIPSCFAVLLLSGLLVMGFGQSDGTVMQWLDDVQISDELDTSYQDDGAAIQTLITTRAYTLDDVFGPKTGMNAEFEFQDSSADNVTIAAIPDMMTADDPVVTGLDTMSQAQLILPFTIPATLPMASIRVVAYDIERYGQWRELQFNISSPAKKLQMRSIRLTGFIDTITLQSQ